MRETKWLRFEEQAGGMSNVQIVCPECGSEYGHIREVFTRMGEDAAEAVVYKGTVARGTVEGERRSAVAVVFDGECGHAWELRIQQHKGTNWIDVGPA